MAFFDWSDELSVNVKEVDDQHKKLIDMINEFYAGIDNKSNNENLLTLLKAMEDYSVYHFKMEEDYMEKFSYDGYEDHKQMHQVYIDKVQDIKGRLKSGKLITSIEVTGFLKDWLKKHIMYEDPKYTDCFIENGVK